MSASAATHAYLDLLLFRESPRVRGRSFEDLLASYTRFDAIAAASFRQHEQFHRPLREARR